MADAPMRLTEENIARGTYDGGATSCCLEGWRRRVFGPFLNNPMSQAVFYCLSERAKELGHRTIEQMNDDDRISKSQLAAIWNVAVKKTASQQKG